ncbi:FAD-dependent oxidoreductase [Catenovulum sediminis]|uniref:FAD-dependent oxidoreductase n=1 Tax=Catenovulum sediminis TaxID=1740262 RepID=A0ABV1RFP9_9ALTE
MNLDRSAKIAVIGGGIAGTTIMLRLAELGIDVTLIEQNESLVSGPPICHLHAGGSFYREISDQQCLTLLKQSIDMLRVFPQCVNVRPTLIAVPKVDPGSPQAILPRLEKLKAQYSELIKAQPDKKLLGEAENYFQLFSREEVERLAKQPLPKQAKSAKDWVIPVAKQLDLEKLQFPLILVQEYGLSGFRFSAVAKLASEEFDNCQVKTHNKVIGITNTAGDNEAGYWQVEVENRQTQKRDILSFDYLINACGFRSGQLDDMLQAPRERLVEFKAAYVARWLECKGQWPEVVFHGQRGTASGMAQLTPYPDGYFQLHGMTPEITLFDDGLVSSTESSAQPKLPPLYLRKIEQGWPDQSVLQRSQSSIAHLSQYIPAFDRAFVAAQPMFGAQQIPGNNPNLRTSDVSFEGDYYARTEIIKASSALTAADLILQKLEQLGLCHDLKREHINQHYFPVTRNIKLQNVVKLAKKIAQARAYPTALARAI